MLTPQQLPANPVSQTQDFSAYRRETIEVLFHGSMQTWALKAGLPKGLARNGTFVIASVRLSQVLFLCHYRQHWPNAHILELSDEARRRMTA